MSKKNDNLDLANLANISSKLKNKKINKENDELRNINLRVDKYYSDIFFKYCNKYFSSGVILKYNTSLFFKIILEGFIQSNDLDGAKEITDKDYLYYIRRGKRRTVVDNNVENIPRNIQIRLHTSKFKEVYKYMHAYYSMKENLAQYDIYSIKFFFIDMLIWLDCDSNFKEHIIDGVGLDVERLK